MLFVDDIFWAIILCVFLIYLFFCIQIRSMYRACGSQRVKCCISQAYHASFLECYLHNHPETHLYHHFYPEMLGWWHEQEARLQRVEEGDCQAAGGPARLHWPAEHSWEQVLLHGPEPWWGGETLGVSKYGRISSSSGSSEESFWIFKEFKKRGRQIAVVASANCDMLLQLRGKSGFAQIIGTV